MVMGIECIVCFHVSLNGFVCFFIVVQFIFLFLFFFFLFRNMKVN